MYSRLKSGRYLFVVQQGEEIRFFICTNDRNFTNLIIMVHVRIPNTNIYIHLPPQSSATSPKLFFLQLSCLQLPSPDPIFLELPSLQLPTLRFPSSIYSVSSCSASSCPASSCSFSSFPASKTFRIEIIISFNHYF